MVKLITDSWNDIEVLIPEYILKYNVKTIAAPGAGANPFLTQEFIQKNGINYTLIDVDEDELAKCSNNFQKKNY